MSVAWGVPYLFIKIAVDDGLSPGFVAWSRVALAALVLLPVALKAGALRGLRLRWLVAFAVTEISIPFPLIAFGETRVSSSLAAILIASLPLVVAFLALRFDRSERPTHRRNDVGADRRRRDPDCHAGLRLWPADRQPPAERRRPAWTGDRCDGHRLDHPAPIRRGGLSHPNAPR
jgi:EamA-like transporter family protein